MINKFCRRRISKSDGCGGWMYFCRARMVDGVAPRVRLAECRLCGQRNHGVDAKTERDAMKGVKDFEVEEAVWDFLGRNEPMRLCEIVEVLFTVDGGELERIKRRAASLLQRAKRNGLVACVKRMGDGFYWVPLAGAVAAKAEWEKEHENELSKLYGVKSI